jgi:hypothetical protein
MTRMRTWIWKDSKRIWRTCSKMRRSKTPLVCDPFPLSFVCERRLDGRLDGSIQRSVRGAAYMYSEPWGVGANMYPMMPPQFVKWRSHIISLTIAAPDVQEPRLPKRPSLPSRRTTKRTRRKSFASCSSCLRTTRCETFPFPTACAAGESGRSW